MKKSRVFNNFAFVFGVVFQLVLPGAWASDFHSARTASLGGAGHANPLLNDAVYLNPSFASFLPTYSMNVNYGWFSGSSDESHNGTLLNASILDGTSELFAAGAAYARRPDVNMIHVGASKAFLNRFGVGVGGKYIIERAQGSRNGQDLTASFTFLATPWLQTVVIGDNLIESDFSKQHEFLREITLGTKFNLQGMAIIYFDPHVTPSLDSSYGHEVGVELTSFTDLFLRLGQFTNSKIPSLNAYGNGFGIGLGWLFPKMSLDYGLERVLTPVLLTTHLLGITIYF